MWTNFLNSFALSIAYFKSEIKNSRIRKRKSISEILKITIPKIQGQKKGKETIDMKINSNQINRGENYHMLSLIYSELHFFKNLEMIFFFRSKFVSATFSSPSHSPNPTIVSPYSKLRAYHFCPRIEKGVSSPKTYYRFPSSFHLSFFKSCATNLKIA